MNSLTEAKGETSQKSKKKKNSPKRDAKMKKKKKKEERKKKKGKKQGPTGEWPSPPKKRNAARLSNVRYILSYSLLPGIVGRLVGYRCRWPFPMSYLHRISREPYTLQSTGRS